MPAFAAVTADSKLFRFDEVESLSNVYSVVAYTPRKDWGWYTLRPSALPTLTTRADHPCDE